MSKPGIDLTLTGQDDMRREIATFGKEVRGNMERGVELTVNAVYRKWRARMRGAKSGRSYRVGRKTHQASASGEGPAIQTRKLIRSVFKRRQGLAGQVGSTDEKALWLEFGAMRAGGNLLRARPGLRPAVNSQRKPWNRRLRRALRKAGRAARAKGRARRR